MSRELDLRSAGPQSAGTPDDKIEEAAAEPPAGDDHRHETVVPEDGTLLEHLGDTHDLDVPPGVSSSTQDGLHDRLHQTEKARDD